MSVHYKCGCLSLWVESLLKDGDNEVPEGKVSSVEYPKASLRTIIYFTVVFQIILINGPFSSM